VRPEPTGEEFLGEDPLGRSTITVREGDEGAEKPPLLEELAGELRPAGAENPEGAELRGAGLGATLLEEEGAEEPREAVELWLEVEDGARDAFEDPADPPCLEEPLWASASAGTRAIARARARIVFGFIGSPGGVGSRRAMHGASPNPCQEGALPSPSQHITTQ